MKKILFEHALILISSATHDTLQWFSRELLELVIKLKSFWFLNFCQGVRLMQQAREGAMSLTFNINGNVSVCLMRQIT